MVSTLFDIVTAFLAFQGALYILARGHPSLFLEVFAVDNETRTGRIVTAWSYTKLIAFIIGVGIFLYYGSAAFLDIIPADWTRIDEDGERQSVREGFQFLFAMMGTAVIMSTSEKQCGKLHDLDRASSGSLRRNDDG